jgi:hypothetical protein
MRDPFEDLDIDPYKDKFDPHELFKQVPPGEPSPMDAGLDDCYAEDWRMILDDWEEGERRSSKEGVDDRKKISKFPIDWTTERLSLFEALQLPESLGRHVFMAVCLRYMKIQPDLLGKKLKQAGIRSGIIGRLLGYLRENFELLEQAYTNAKQFQIVDKYLRFEYDEKSEKRLTGISVPEDVKAFFDFRRWYDTGRHGIPLGPKFIGYLDSAMRGSLALLDDESSGKSPEEREREFYEFQEWLWRLHVSQQSECHTDEEWGKNARHAPLANQIAELLTWDCRERAGRRTLGDDEWRKLGKEFKGQIPKREHDIEPRLYSRVGRHSGALHISMPCSGGKDIDYGRWGGYRYFDQRPDMIYRDFIPDTEKRFLGELDDTTQILMKGSVVEWDRDNLMIQLGVRRTARPDEETIAKGLYVFDNSGEEWWRALYPKPEFYTQCLSQHFTGEAGFAIDDPFQWALERAKVAAGYVTAMGVGSDYPIDHFHHQFTRMAGIVCNSTPRGLVEPREFQMTDSKRSLLSVAQEKFGEACCPEIAWFVLENCDVVTAEVLADQDFLELLAKIPACLENGLVMDRLQDLYKAGCEKDLDPLGAMKFALKVVGDIFGPEGKKEPWWFKEDFDICGVFDATGDKCTVSGDGFQIAYCEEGRKIVSDVAEEAGFAFTYAIELYKRVGYKFVTIPGLDPVDAFRFLCEVVELYGIGNIGRACNIINFAIEHVNEVPAGQRPASLELFKELAISSAPSSKVIGAMEGEEATLAMPGCSALMLTCIGSDRMRELKFDDSVVSPSALREIAASLNTPLAERARLIPGILRHSELADRRHRLLTAGEYASRLSLPAPQASALATTEQTAISCPIDTPSNSIFAFFRQVREECRGIDQRVVQTYMGLYATKFPNPFNPPKGFLGFLQKFLSIPNPRHLEAVNAQLFAHPLWGGGERRDAAVRSVRATIDRNLIISNLLDAQLMGLLTWGELQEIFDWMVADLPNEHVLELERKVRGELGGMREHRAQMLKEIIAKRDAREVRGLPRIEYGRDDGDDSDLAPMTPDGEDEFVKHRVEDETERAASQMRLRRVRIVEDGINFIAVTNILVTLGLITPGDFRQLIVEHLKMMPLMEKYYPLFDKIEFDFPLINKDVFAETVEILQTLKNWGIFNSEAFLEGLSPESPLEQRYALLREFFFCVGAYRRSSTIASSYRERMSSHISQLSQRSDPHGIARLFDEGAAVVDEMDTTLQQVWGLTPLIASTVTVKIIGEVIDSLLTKEEYPRVFEAMEALGRLGAYDPETFEQAFDKNTPAKTRYRLLQQIFLCAAAYTESGRLIAKFNSKFCRKVLPPPPGYTLQADAAESSASHDSGDYYRRMISDLERSLRKCWEGISCVSPDVADILLAAALRTTDYMRVFEIVRRVREQVHSEGTPLRGEGDVAGNTRVANITSFTALASLFAAETLRAEDDPAGRQVTQLLLTDGGAVDIPEPGAKIDLYRFPEYDETHITELVANQADAVVSSLRMYRKECLGLVTVGGKLHVANCNADKLQAIINLMGLSPSGFQLQYMDGALLLPATLTGAELKAFILMLVRAGIVSPENLQLQVTGPGRLSLENAAFLGSAVLLATERGCRFSEKSFCSKAHDRETGARIMLYDANAPITRLPFTGKLKGRTDMLGRMHLGDVDLYQWIYSVLAHEQFGGPFGKFAKEFKRKYVDILERHGIADVLQEKWIYAGSDDRRDDEASKRHHQTITKVTDAYFDCADMVKATGRRGGIVFEVRNLIEELKESVRGEQEKLYGGISACQDAELAVNF